MAMMKAVFGLCLVFTFHQEATTKATTTLTEKLALVSESYVRDNKRQMELLPDELPIDIVTENEKAHIHLTKQKNIDLEKIKSTVFDSELVEKPHVSKRIVGYYQDRTNAAVIAVTAKQTNDKVLRTLEGTLVLNDKAYEIRPDQEGRSILSALLQEGNHINANVHVLKEVEKPINSENSSEIVTNDDTVVQTLLNNILSLDEQPKYCVPTYTYSPDSKTYQDKYGKLCITQVNVRCPSSPSRCVPPTKMCDTVSDCPNGEDEDEQFCRKLSSGRPGYIRHPYDAYKVVKEWDCQKAVDDPVYVNDPAYTKPVDYCEKLPKYCPYEIFGGINCPNKPWECIGPNVACDGVNDCGASNGEVGDETLEFCASLCDVGEFKCPGNEEMKCVPAYYACDDDDDCVDGRDENRTFCDELSLIMNLTIVCKDGQVKCNGSMQCIYESWLCDSTVDCMYAEDEKDCPGTDKNCTLGEISCPNAVGICIDISYMCDGVIDCPDSVDEDESYCNNQTVAVCSDDGVNCPGRPYGCIPSNWICDGDDDCGDYSDEHACTPVTCPVSSVACPDTLFCEVQCPGSPHICVPQFYLCDNEKDCYGDEEAALCNKLPPADCDQFGLDLSEVYSYEYYYYYYPYSSISTPEYVACPGFNARCVVKDYICDNDEDCYDGVDEANCIVEKETEHQIRKQSREISYIKKRREEHEQSIGSRKEKRHEVTLQRKEQKEHALQIKEKKERANTQRKAMWQHNKSQREERKESIQSRWNPQRTNESKKELRSPAHAQRAMQEKRRTRS